MPDQRRSTRPIADRVSAGVARVGKIDRGWQAVLLGFLIVAIQLGIQLLG